MNRHQSMGFNTPEIDNFLICSLITSCVASSLVFTEREKLLMFFLSTSYSYLFHKCGFILKVIRYNQHNTNQIVMSDALFLPISIKT